MKVIQIGYGYWGANVARNLAASDKFEFYALCEQLPSRAAKARSVLPESVRITDDYDALLRDDSVEGVVIVTQTENTFALGMKAMDAGKHVFMEKPIATTVERAEKLKAKAEETGLVLHCDHLMLYNPVIRYIKNMIDTGELGDLEYVDVSRINLGVVRKDVNALLDLAVHDIAVIDYLSGGKEPLALSAMGETPFGRREALTYLTMQYDGFLAHIKSSWVSPIKERRMMIGGSKKMVIFDDMKQADKLAIYDCGIEVKQGDEYGQYEFLSRVGDIRIPYIPFEDSLRNSLEHFAHCAQTHTQSLSGPDQSLRVMRILDAAQRDLSIRR